MVIFVWPKRSMIARSCITPAAAALRPDDNRLDHPRPTAAPARNEAAIDLIVARHGQPIGNLTHDGFEWRWRATDENGPPLIRQTTPGRLPRRLLAMEDFASVLGVPTAAKYDGTIERIARALRPLSTAPDEDVLLVLKRALFAWLIADGDMHLKNLALLMRAFSAAQLATLRCECSAAEGFFNAPRYHPLFSDGMHFANKCKSSPA